MKMTKTLSLAVLLTATVLTGFTDNYVHKYSAITAQSQITWLAKKVTGEHGGKIQLKNGTLDFEDDKLIGGEFTIDMGTITCIDIENEQYNKKLVGHLKSTDFFNVEKYGTALFNITKTKEIKSTEGNYEITGDLTIKGITNEISFPATITISNNIASASATLIFDRTKFDIHYKSTSFFDSLGDKAIYDDVEMGIIIKAKL